MAVLALHEYECIERGQTFDPAKRIVTIKQHGMLERFSEGYKRLHKIAVFQHGPRGSLIAQNFVGVIRLGRDQVEVLPKIEGKDSEVRHNLVRMISVVMSLELFDGGSTKIEKSNDSILEILISLFCARLWQAVRRGMVRQYESREENLPVLRGRLSVASQIRLNLARPDRLACVFDEFTENNPLNQALKAALRVLGNVARSQANQRNISELIFWGMSEILCVRRGETFSRRLKMFTTYRQTQWKSQFLSYTIPFVNRSS